MTGVPRGLIAVGVIALVLGVYDLNRSRVEDAGRNAYTGGSYESFERKVEADKTRDWLMLGVGSVLLVGGLVLRSRQGGDEDPEGGAFMKECRACLKKIPAAASRCSFCTEDLRVPPK